MQKMQLFSICHLCLFPRCLHLIPCPLSDLHCSIYFFAIVIFAFLKLAFFNSIFFAIVIFAFLKLALFNPIFFAIVIFDFLKLAFFISIFLHLSFLPFFELHFFNPIVCIVSAFFQAENILEQARFDITSLATASFVATGEPPPHTRSCGRRFSPFWLQTYTLRLHLFSSKTAENFQSVAACLASIKHHLGQYGRRVS